MRGRVVCESLSTHSARWQRVILYLASPTWTPPLSRLEVVMKPAMLLPPARRSKPCLVPAARASGPGHSARACCPHALQKCLVWQSAVGGRRLLQVARRLCCKAVSAATVTNNGGIERMFIATSFQSS